MPDHLTWFVGNREPSITENLVDSEGNPYNLTGKTVRFKAREVGSSSLLVDQPAVVVLAANGDVRYDFTANDIDPAFNGAAVGGIFSKERPQVLVWWEVTIASGRTQDYGEAILQVLKHGPVDAYLEVAELKKTLEVARNYADIDIRKCLITASRMVDDLCHRPYGFGLGAAAETRYYSARTGNVVRIDDLVDLDTVHTAPTGDATFSDAWTENADYVLEPLGAPAQARPWEAIRQLSTGTYRWPAYPRSVRVVGQFGWPTVPEEAKVATAIVAGKILKRVRESPHGVLVLGAEATPIRVSRFDPDLELVLKPITRSQVLA